MAAIIKPTYTEQRWTAILEVLKDAQQHRNRYYLFNTSPIGEPEEYPDAKEMIAYLEANFVMSRVNVVYWPTSGGHRLVYTKPSTDCSTAHFVEHDHQGKKTNLIHGRATGYAWWMRLRRTDLISE